MEWMGLSRGGRGLSTSGFDQTSGQHNSKSELCCPVMIRRCSWVNMRQFYNVEGHNIPETSCAMSRLKRISETNSIRIERSKCPDIDNSSITIPSQPCIPGSIGPRGTQDTLNIAELWVSGRWGRVDLDLRCLQRDGYE
jgi:hypothetical protein